jgi:hypothetical protein
MQFLRDFEVIPDILTAKQGFLIWYTLTQYSEKNCFPDLSVADESTMSGKVQLPFDKGIFFKLSDFTHYLYKAAILSYNMKIIEKEQDSTKKLLYFLRKLERSTGFLQIQKLTNRPMNSVTTLLPPQDVLIEIFGNASVESDLTLLPTYLESERAVSAILSESLSDREKSTIIRERLRGDHEAKKRLLIDDDAEMFLEQVYEDLKRVFEIYSSIGDPLNTESMKSSKALKLIQDCKLLRSTAGNLILSED